MIDRNILFHKLTSFIHSFFLPDDYCISTEMHGENVQGNLWVEESLFCSITKVLAIYIHLRQTLIGRPLAGSSSLQQQLLQWMFHIPILVHLLIGSRIACYRC